MLIGTKMADPGGTAPGPKQPLGQILKDMELISEYEIQVALSIQRSDAGRIGQILFKLGHVAKEEILLALAFQQGVDLEELEDIDDLREDLRDILE